MSSYGLHFLLAISVILRLRNVLLVFFTVLQKDFQSSRLFKDLYFSRSLLQLLSYQLLEYFVMSVSFVFLSHILSMFLAKLLTAFSNKRMLKRFETSKFLIVLIVLFTNCSSLTLFFQTVLLCILINSSGIGIVTVKGASLEERHYLGWMEWLLRIDESHWRNIRSMTKFESLMLSAYLVGTWLVGNNSDKWKESVIIIKSSLMDEWCKKDRSHRLSLILISPTMIRRFWIFTSVSFRYFKTKWEISEYMFINQKN